MGDSAVEATLHKIINICQCWAHQMWEWKNFNFAHHK